MDTSFERLEDVLGYRFRNPELLKTALTHRSFRNESRASEDIEDNERLEFLGDAVLGLLIAEWAMEECPALREGGLTRLRSGLVAKSYLAKIARAWGLSRYLLLGRAVATTGAGERDSLLSDALEAVVAAVYLDGGMEAARGVVRRHFRARMIELAARTRAWADPKSAVQELCAGLLKTHPTYQVVEESGPDHSKRFCVALSLFSTTQAVGKGPSKKAAEQEAARVFLERLKTNPLGLL